MSLEKPKRTAWCPRCREEREFRRVACCRTCKTPVQRKRRVGPRSRRAGATAQARQMADDQWSLLVKERAPYCRTCGSRDNLQAAHGFGRTHWATRFEPWNGVTLCRGCHVKYTHRPLEWTALLKQWWGEKLYEEREIMARRIVKRKRADYERIVADLKRAREEAA